MPIFRAGRLVYEPPPIAAIRKRAQTQLRGLHEGHKRFLNPREYPAGLSPGLHELRARSILEARGLEGAELPGMDARPPPATARKMERGAHRA